MFKTPKKHLFRTIKQINHTTNKNKLTFKANTVSTVYTRAKLCLDLSFTLNPNGALKPDNPVFPDQLFANVCVCVQAAWRTRWLDRCSPGRRCPTPPSSPPPPCPGLTTL